MAVSGRAPSQLRVLPSKPLREAELHGGVTQGTRAVWHSLGLSRGSKAMAVLYMAREMARRTWTSEYAAAIARGAHEDLTSQRSGVRRQDYRLRIQYSFYVYVYDYVYVYVYDY